MGINLVFGGNRRRNRKPGPVSKIFFTLFLLPFLGFGLYFTFLNLQQVGEWYAMQQWAAVPGDIRSVDLKESRSDGSSTYRATARFTYTYNGHHYTGSRASLHSDESDNIGSFQQDTANALKQYQSRQGNVTVYVNPDNPKDSILIRDFRWGLFTFKLLFGLIFAAFGAGVFYALWRQSARNPQNNANGYPVDESKMDKPWLQNKDWQTPEIRSDAKLGIYVVWAFCIVWNGISMPLIFMLLPEIFEKENYAAALGLLFPLVGVVVFAKAIQMTLEYRRFGKTVIALDPFPGAIGGHVGGTLDLNQSFDSRQKFEITLGNYYSYISGSGKNRSRKERAVWSRTAIAHAEPYLTGTRLYFRFDVPDEGVEPSDAAQEYSDYYLWRANLTSTMPGVDIDRNFVIPVYPTGEKSTEISDRVVAEITEETLAHDKQGLTNSLPLKHGLSGYELFYPAFRNVKAAFAWGIFGAVFLGIAATISMEDDSFQVSIMAVIFALVGIVILLGAIYALTNSLHVYSDGANLISHRRVLGIFSFKKLMPLGDIAKLSYRETSSTSAGNRTTITYQIRAIDRNEKYMTIAEGLEGMGQAELAIQELKKTFHLE